MKKQRSISGFSKLSKLGKLKWIVENFFKDPELVMHELKSYWLPDEQQRILDGFSENTITNFYLPFGVAPNFLINGRTYCVPMVIEESSVVAAAASSAKYWQQRGGFTCTVVDTLKVGQVHFTFDGPEQLLHDQMPHINQRLLQQTEDIWTRMKARGGGIVDVVLKKHAPQVPYAYQLFVTARTADSMGANFLNTLLEKMADVFSSYCRENDALNPYNVEIIMAILSNNTPDCLVKAVAECPISALASPRSSMDPKLFAERFATAVQIAEVDPYRAATHNKGIFNGVDAVIQATGNDYRATEAAGHAYAARNGQYRSLSECQVDHDHFRFSLDLPLALGTVGGLTDLHPMARRSLELLDNPSAEDLMMIAAAVGLAQNFAAIRSLITHGIQRGHMQMHLSNILQRLAATPSESEVAQAHFNGQMVSQQAVRDFILMQRASER